MVYYLTCSLLLMNDDKILFLQELRVPCLICEYSLLFLFFSFLLLFFTL